METDKRHSRVYGLLKVAGALLGGVLLLLLAGRLALNSDWLRTLAKERGVAAVNRQINGMFEVDKLEGDLWKEMRLTGIRIRAGAGGETPDTLISADTLKISYRPLSLLSPVFEVRELRIGGLTAGLAKREGKWNFEDVFPSPGGEAGSMGVRIEEFSIERGEVTAAGVPVPPDSLLQAGNLRIGGSFAYAEERYNLRLGELSFLLEGSRGRKEIRVESAWRAGEESVTLERLVLATGSSLLRSSGSLGLVDTAASLRLEARPLAWEDLSDYWARAPAPGDLQLQLSASGTPGRFGIEVDATSENLEKFRMEADFSWREELALRRARLTLDSVRPAALWGDSTLAVRRMRNVDIRVEGRAAENLQDSALEGRFESGEIVYGAGPGNGPGGRVDSIGGRFGLDGAVATVGLDAYVGRQHLRADTRVDNLWDSAPSHRTTATVRRADPAYWMQDETWEGPVDLRISLAGRGWQPEGRFWDYEINAEGGGYAGYRVESASVSGNMRRDSVRVSGMLTTGENSISLEGGAALSGGEPRFRYRLETEGFDLSALPGLGDFPTSLNAILSGGGRGSGPASLMLESTLAIDSSIVNRERLDRLTARLAVEDTALTVSEGRLESSMARGTFGGRLHLLRAYDSSNDLEFDMELLDLSPLAALGEAGTFQAVGNIGGSVVPVNGEDLRFAGNLSLEKVRYEELMSVEKMKGNLELLLKEDPEYRIDVDLVSPVIASRSLGDLQLESAGSVEGERFAGNFQMRLGGREGGELVHAGTYRAAGDSLALTTSRLDLSGEGGALTLGDSFEVTYHAGTVRTDTLRLVSAEGERASLELAVPYGDSLRQEAWMRGEHLNTATLQNLFLRQERFKGMLSGELYLHRRETRVDGRGTLELTGIDYRDTRFDTLNVGFVLAENHLDGTLRLRDGGVELVEGELHVPFRLGNPSLLSNAFFQQEVSGRLETRQVELERFESLLAQLGISQTRGLLSFNGQLSGTAGSPDVEASATLSQAVLSGVTVDTVTARLDYSHEASRLNLSASVISLRQHAADISAEVPFYLDFREFSLRLPSGEDPVSAEVVTNRFNLAALNDFVDREYVRQIEGEVDGVLQIGGTVENPRAKGEMNFRRGALRLVEAGIRIDRIESRMIFEKDRLRLDSFSARSGSGTFRSSGTAELDDLWPGELDLALTARNFKAANTARYNANINLDAQVRGTPSRPEISGNLSVLNGFIVMGNFGEQAVEQVDLDVPEGTDYTVNLYDSLSLDMDISFDRRFYVRNRRYLEMEMELRGDVDVLKEAGGEMQIFGTLNSVQGYASPLGKRFSLEEGVLTFSGNPYNPDIRVRSLFEPHQSRQEISIWYIIEGTVENPSFRYESAPPMELENIISYTLFGQPFYALDSWKQVVAGSGANTTAADVALDVLLDRLESIATRRLGIDVVQIDNTRVGGESGTAVTTGWYLSSRVFFAVQNVLSDSTPDTHFLLEYLLRRNLKLIISQGDDSRQGVDLKWNYDY